ncbi:MAG: ComEA family DNA-binding protein [Lachnospiraceae bacterium]|nr:ComEA family DNA-binding protein [Lachnospiraceae bacterium]
MLWKKRGLATALLCVVLTGASGCGERGTLYTAGLTVETESTAENLLSSAETESAEEDTRSLAETESAQEGGLSLAETETEAILGYVYVCGAVKEPGVYPIRGDMRVCDAIAQAGGFSLGADEEWLNQAAAVRDGQKLYVYSTEETALLKASGASAEGMSSETAGMLSEGNSTADEAVSAGSGEAADTSDGKVNLNTATAQELMTLPGIGEAKAAAILAYRSEHGAFASIEEIQNISGIKSGVFSKIKDLITV